MDRATRALYFPCGCCIAGSPTEERPPKGPCESSNSIDKSVDNFNALKIHQAVEHNVDAHLRDQGLIEQLLVKDAQFAGVEGGDFGGEGGEHCLSWWWGLPLTP